MMNFVKYYPEEAKLHFQTNIFRVEAKMSLIQYINYYIIQYIKALIILKLGKLGWKCNQ